LIGRSLADLLLSPTALGTTTATRPALFEAARRAAGPEGLVEDIVHEGDLREPAQLSALFASPGDPELRPTLLFLHGKGGSGAEWRRDVVRAMRLGCNVLVPELRGHAPSTGPRITYGHFEKTDLAILVETATERFGVDPARLAIDGCSMGSHIALQLASGPAPVRALWLQAPFSSLVQMAVQYIQRATSLPRWLVEAPARFSVLQVERASGLALAELDPVEAASLVTCPAFVVHGEGDALVPIDYSARVYAALGGPKEMWRAPRCGHCHHPDEPQAVRGREYRERWTAFFRKHLFEKHRRANASDPRLERR